jgi:2-methylcitrate dehydratase
MDKTTAQLVDYTASFSESMISEAAREAAVRHLVDSVACAIAGYNSTPGRIATKVSSAVPSEAGALIIGSNHRVAPDMAAFANTTMVRTYDWNDGMFAKGGGHPSDMIGAILAVAEVAGSSPQDTLMAMVLAYELLGALGDTTPLRAMEWDQGTFMTMSAALAMGRLLGLTEEQLGHAVAFSIVTGVPLFVTRVGAISMWKGSATAAAMRTAVFAVSLAQAGMTGPAEPFAGKSGLWEKVTGEFDVSLPANPGGPTVVEMSYMKRYPSELHSQSMIGLAPRIVSLSPLDEIESIDIETYWHAWDSIGKGAVKWDPDTRETADHSLPYLLSVALVDGGVSLESFTPERIADPTLRPLMAKISVRENDEFTEQFRPPGMEIIGSPRMRATIRTRSGQEFVEEVTYHKGHSLNPMSADDINAKLDAACKGVIDEDRREKVRAAWWGVEEAASIREPIETLADFPNLT